MPRLSNLIEEFLKQLIYEAEDGIIEIKRNELAQYFNCAPSQINYVLTTRFTPYKGYYIESRRGGGGYIKIIKVNIDENDYMSDIIINSIGNSISKTKAYRLIDSFIEENIISLREGQLMKIAIGDNSLGRIMEYRNELRADILKNMLLVLIRK